MSFSERLQEFMKFAKIKSASQLSQQLGYRQSEKVNRLFRKKTYKPSYVMLHDISEHYPDLNMNWLITGRGDMLLSSIKETQRKENPIPVYDILVSAGDNIKFWEDPENVVTTVPRDFGVKDSDMAIYVYGDSMHPSYLSGDMIFLKRVKDYSLISYGQVYVVITDEHRFLKYLMRGRNAEHILLHSENSHYEDIELSKRKILRLYRVQGFFRKIGL